MTEQELKLLQEAKRLHALYEELVDHAKQISEIIHGVDSVLEAKLKAIREDIKRIKERLPEVQ